MLDVVGLFWMTSEMASIGDVCKSGPPEEYNIFLVDNPSNGRLGSMDFNQKYGFVHADTSGYP